MYQILWYRFWINNVKIAKDQWILFKYYTNVYFYISGKAELNEHVSWRHITLIFEKISIKMPFLGKIVFHFTKSYLNFFPNLHIFYLLIFLNETYRHFMLKSKTGCWFLIFDNILTLDLILGYNTQNISKHNIFCKKLIRLANCTKKS